MTTGKTLLWLLIVTLAAATGVFALTTFLIPGVGDPTFKAQAANIPWGAMLHIVPSGLVLTMGGFQFHRGLRSRWPTCHRHAGRAYISLSLVASIGGFLLAWHTPISVATTLGFASLAAIWFYTGLMAYFTVRRGRIKLHRQWAIRSYALTLAAVTLRIELVIFQEVMGLTFEESFAIVAWFSWIPNLIVAEWIFVAQAARIMNYSARVDVHSDANSAKIMSSTHSPRKR